MLEPVLISRAGPFDFGNKQQICFIPPGEESPKLPTPHSSPVLRATQGSVPVCEESGV